MTPLSAQGHYFSYFLTIRLDARCFGRGARALLEVRRRGKHPAAIVWSPLNKRRYHRESGSSASPGFTYRCAVPRRRVVSRRLASSRVGTPPTLKFFHDSQYPQLSTSFLLLLLFKRDFHLPPTLKFFYQTRLG